MGCEEIKDELRAVKTIMKPSLPGPVSHLAYRTVVAEVTPVLALPDAPLRSGCADLAEGTVAV